MGGDTAISEELIELLLQTFSRLIQGEEVSIEREGLRKIKKETRQENEEREREREREEAVTACSYSSREGRLIDHGREQ